MMDCETVDYIEWNPRRGRNRAGKALAGTKSESTALEVLQVGFEGANLFYDVADGVRALFAMAGIFAQFSAQEYQLQMLADGIQCLEWHLLHGAHPAKTFGGPEKVTAALLPWDGSSTPGICQ
jgi:hypothetical protein